MPTHNLFLLAASAWMLAMSPACGARSMTGASVGRGKDPARCPKVTVRVVGEDGQPLAGVQVQTIASHWAGPAGAFYVEGGYQEHHPSETVTTDATGMASVCNAVAAAEAHRARTNKASLYSATWSATWFGGPTRAGPVDALLLVARRPGWPSALLRLGLLMLVPDANSGKPLELVLGPPRDIQLDVRSRCAPDAVALTVGSEQTLDQPRVERGAGPLVKVTGLGPFSYVARAECCETQMTMPIDGRVAKGTLVFSGSPITFKAPGFEGGRAEILIPPPSDRVVKTAAIDDRGTAAAEVPEGDQYCVKVTKDDACDVALLYPRNNDARPLVFGDPHAIATCGACPQPANARPSLTMTSIRSLALGAKTSCALLVDGTVRCWGSNDMGMLGDGSGMTQPTPVPVEGLSEVAEIGVGAEHACARKGDGSVWCWGYNSSGQLGDGTSKGNRSVPEQISDLTATSLSIGRWHNCAVTKAQQVECWGWNDYRQLGVADDQDRTVPTLVAGLSDVKQVRAGHFHTCARLRDGRVSCWGWNSHGQLGDGARGESTFRDTPVTVAGLNGATDISLGAYHTCAIAAGDQLMCWGQGTAGPPTDSVLPKVVPGVPPIERVATAFQTCVRASSGAVLCWSLGGGSPAPIAGIDGKVADLAVGDGHGCALLPDGSVRCWGSGSKGQLGDGRCMERYGAAAAESVPVRF